MLTAALIHHFYVAGYVGYEPSLFCLDADARRILDSRLSRFCIPTIWRRSANPCGRSAESPADGDLSFLSCWRRCSSQAGGNRLARLDRELVPYRPCRAGDRAHRAGAHHFLMAKAGRLARRAVVVGGGEFGHQLLRTFGDAENSEISMLGVFDDRGDDRSPLTVEGFPKTWQCRRSRRIRPPHAHRSGDIRAADHRRDAHPADAAQTMVLPIDIRLSAHANRLRFRPALLFLCRRGARSRSFRQADRRLGRRHQTRLRQDRRRGRPYRAVANSAGDGDRD